VASALLSTSAFSRAADYRKNLNVSSFMGLIMVIGIVAKTESCLLDADQKFRDQGSTHVTP